MWKRGVASGNFSLKPSLQYGGGASRTYRCVMTTVTPEATMRKQSSEMKQYTLWMAAGGGFSHFQTTPRRRQLTWYNFERAQLNLDSEHPQVSWILVVPSVWVRCI